MSVRRGSQLRMLAALVLVVVWELPVLAQRTPTSREAVGSPRPWEGARREEYIKDAALRAFTFDDMPVLTRLPEICEGTGPGSMWLSPQEENAAATKELHVIGACSTNYGRHTGVARERLREYRATWQCRSATDPFSRSDHFGARFL